jgi:hypothetical protein
MGLRLPLLWDLTLRQWVLGSGSIVSHKNGSLKTIQFFSSLYFCKHGNDATGLYSEGIKSNLWGHLPCQALIRLCRRVMGWFLEMIPFRSLSNQVHVCPVETFESLQITFPSLQETRGHLTQHLFASNAGLIILSRNTALYNF